MALDFLEFRMTVAPNQLKEFQRSCVASWIRHKTCPGKLTVLTDDTQVENSKLYKPVLFDLTIENYP